MTNELLKDMIRRHEGLRLKPYRCPAGKLTIGYGHNLDDRGIPLEIAERLLDLDIEDARRDLFIVLPNAAGFSDARRAALVDLMFNLGRARFSGFQRMIAALEREDFTAAARELMDSRYAAQVPARARELAQMLREG